MFRRHPKGEVLGNGPRHVVIGFARRREVDGALYALLDAGLFEGHHHVEGGVVGQGTARALMERHDGIHKAQAEPVDPPSVAYRAPLPEGLVGGDGSTVPDEADPSGAMPPLFTEGGGAGVGAGGTAGGRRTAGGAAVTG